MLEIIALIIVGGMVGIAYLLSYVVEFFAAIILGLFWGVVELIKSAISPKETEKTTATKAVETKKEEEKKENINNTETDREEEKILTVICLTRTVHRMLELSAMTMTMMIGTTKTKTMTMMIGTMMTMMTTITIMTTVKIQSLTTTIQC